MSQFSDRPFAAGSLFGIRSFRVDDGGVLTGCVQRLPWRQGVNEAGCHQGSVYGYATAMQALALPPRPALPTHDIGALSCTCGFYAYYYLGDNPHHHSGNVLGIIEGYGVTTVGSRGFRCSKARIRALIAPRGLDAVYDGIPRFSTVEAALAEFPLTPVEQSDPPELTSPRRYRRGGFIPAAWTTGVLGTSWLAPAIREAESKPKRAATAETPQERALRLRRERNTGPANQHGLDGHHRRKNREST